VVARHCGLDRDLGIMMLLREDSAMTLECRGFSARQANRMSTSLTLDRPQQRVPERRAGRYDFRLRGLLYFTLNRNFVQSLFALNLVNPLVHNVID
jgi:hypothetical protein